VSDHDQRPAAARPFQVDLRGVVDLLSRHIYSSPQVFLRELLQNGRDAVAARSLLDPDAPAGELLIEPSRDGAPFRFRDDGVGLTLDEASELLSTVGRSSKRDEVLALRREEFLGQFGIGMLSCFMVADRIVVRSRSARGTAPIEWIGDSSGTFSLRELGGDEGDGVAVGTTVELQARPDDAALLGPESVAALARRFGEYLPLSVRVQSWDGSWDTVSRPAVFLDASADDPRVRELGAEWLGGEPLDVIPLDVAGSGTRGIAYVLPFTPSPGARQTHRVYLGRMLMGEHVGDLLPEWAFFVRCVIDTTGLTPTASREQLIDDANLEFTREQLSAELRRWILRIAKTDPVRFARFLSVHQLALKAVAVHDDELATALLPSIVFETSAGLATLETLLDGGPIRFAETNDEFRQVAPIADLASPIVNGGYTYDAELLRRVPALLEHPVQRVTVSDVLDDLAAPPLEDRVLSSRLEQRATLALQASHVEVSTRAFEPVDLPGLSVIDPEVIRRIERQRTAESTTPVWSRVLGGVDALLEQRREQSASAPSARLCLNWANPLVRRLAELDDLVVFDRTVRLLHVQSLLAAHRPLGPDDRRMLTTALDDIVQLSVLGGPTLPSASADPSGDPA